MKLEYNAEEICKTKTEKLDLENQDAQGTAREGQWLCDIQEKGSEDDTAIIPEDNGCTVCREAERTYRVWVHKYINSQTCVCIFHGSGGN